MRITSRSDGRGRALDALIADWANATPAVKRVWLIDGPDERPLDLELELAPVADSEETAVAWLAGCEKWRAQLEARTRREVELEWLDADEGSGGTPAGRARVLVFDRSC